MKIEFDKAILWLIPYLYLVSILYYWGYWGTLGIDVFNYYPVTDLVKGITAPLKSSLALSLFSSIYFIFIKFAIEKSKKQIFVYFLWIIGFVILLARSIRDYNTVTSHTHYERLLFYLELFEQSSIYFSVLIAYYINKNLNAVNRILDYARFSLICAALILPSQSFCNGRTTALATQFNRNFIYTLTAYVTKRVAVYKYLGKTGDYQVLETLDNYKKVIIPVAELKPFIIEEYVVDDKGSLSRFRANIRRVNILNNKAK